MPQSLWKEVRDRAIAMMREIKMGDPRDFRNFMSAVIDKKAFDKISGYVADAKKRAKVLHGGGVDDKNISHLKKMTMANEFHLSARMLKPSRMRYRNEFVIMSSEDTDEYAHDVFDAETFRKVRANAIR